MKNSLKKRFAVAFSGIALLVIIICSLSAYTYEVLIGRLAEYSLSQSELNEFRFQFGEFNTAVNEYLEDGSLDSREKYGNLKNELVEISESINSKYSSAEDKVESSLAVSVYSTFSKYVQQTDEVINSVNRDEAKTLYTEKYSRNAGYIENYTEKLISSRYKTTEKALADINSRIKTFKVFLVLALVILALLLLALAFMLFRYVLAPVEKLSRQSKQIANFNFDINIETTGNDDEISVLSSNFRNMKNSLKEFFETNEKNIQVLDDLLIQFEGNKELKAYINSQREVNDAIFRQANIDQVSGTMNHKAFTHCVKDDIALMDPDKICLLAAVEIINYSEISNTVYEGADELLRTTVKHLNYIIDKSGYVARSSKGTFLIFIPAIESPEKADKICTDMINAIDNEFVYKRVRCHVSARVNAIVSSSPKSEKMMINYVINGLESIDPGKIAVSRNNI